MAHFLINSGRSVKQSLHIRRPTGLQLAKLMVATGPYRAYPSLNWGQVLLEWRG